MRSRMNAFKKYGLDQTMCDFSANVAFDKATNGQTAHSNQ